jgi:nucleoid-associated protein YgaU
MFKIIPIFLLTLLFAYSCSSSKETNDKGSGSSSSSDDFSDFEDLDLDNNGEQVASAGATQSDDSSEIIYGDDLDDEDFEEEDDFDNEVSNEVADFDDEFEDTQRSISSAVVIGGEVAQYKVKKGETLMLIAFNLYGDYSKWKDLRNMNPGLSSSSLSSGQVIKYQAPNKEFTWSPAGKPYLIKSGDTLGRISNQKYGTPAKWRDIYDNNRPMIKNPNLIFAGFTLYYIDGESDFAFNK